MDVIDDDSHPRCEPIGANGAQVGQANETRSIAKSC
jgi:hypothetical protein